MFGTTGHECSEQIASGAVLLFQFRYRFFDETESEVFGRCALDGCHRFDLCGAIRNPNVVAVELADARGFWTPTG